MFLPGNRTLRPDSSIGFSLSAEQGNLRPVICINKVDLVDRASLQPVVGLYSQLGYQVLLTSIVSGEGILSLRNVLQGQESVLSGQSGVGKSSLLNVVDPQLQLPVNTVSADIRQGTAHDSIGSINPVCPLAAGWSTHLAFANSGSGT